MTEDKDIVSVYIGKGYSLGQARDILRNYYGDRQSEKLVSRYLRRQDRYLRPYVKSMIDEGYRKEQVRSLFLGHGHEAEVMDYVLSRYESFVYSKKIFYPITFLVIFVAIGIFFIFGIILEDYETDDELADTFPQFDVSPLDTTLSPGEEMRVDISLSSVNSNVIDYEIYDEDDFRLKSAQMVIEEDSYQTSIIIPDDSPEGEYNIRMEVPEDDVYESFSFTVSDIGDAEDTHDEEDDTDIEEDDVFDGVEPSDDEIQDDDEGEIVYRSISERSYTTVSYDSLSDTSDVPERYGNIYCQSLPFGMRQDCYDSIRRDPPDDCELTTVVGREVCVQEPSEREEIRDSFCDYFDEVDSTQECREFISQYEGMGEIIEMIPTQNILTSSSPSEVSNVTEFGEIEG